MAIRFDMMYGDHDTGRMFRANRPGKSARDIARSGSASRNISWRNWVTASRGRLGMGREKTLRSEAAHGIFSEGLDLQHPWIRGLGDHFGRPIGASLLSAGTISGAVRDPGGRCDRFVGVEQSAGMGRPRMETSAIARRAIDGLTSTLRDPRSKRRLQEEATRCGLTFCWRSWRLLLRV